MSGSTPPPPPGGAPPDSRTVTVPLAAPGGRLRLARRKGGEHVLTLTPREISVEHASGLQAPLRFAPGSVVVASVDPGPADTGGDRARGRFPILRRIGDRIIPREEGIEGWVWTSADGSAFVVLGEEAPNLAFVFSPPLSGERIDGCFDEATLADLAKRSPLGQPAVFGLLLRAEQPHALPGILERYGLAGPITDREIPPTQRRRLPGDKPANPRVDLGDAGRERTSVPPPGRS